MPESYFCEKCLKTMSAEQFYGSNNLEKYPDGKLRQCKKCISMHIDNFNPDTYLWILQECDVPYVPDEWHKLLEKYAKDKSKLTGMTILGRYLSKMKLKQFKDYRWKDTDFLQELANNKIEQVMKRQGYDAQEIALAVAKASNEIPERILNAEEVAAMAPPPSYQPESTANYPDYFAEQSGAADDFVEDLTEEEKKYLRLKWGKTYKPEEWIKLEQLYEEMMSSYDIQTAGHIDTLKLICKTSLKANQLIDIGDVEGYQKISKVYDNLMKSGKFTAAQNKAEAGEFVDSIGELVALCEQEGYIERFYIDEPNDKVDVTIKDMQKYTKTLIDQETNLSALVEAAIKQNMKEDEEDVEDSDEIIFDDELDVDDIEKQLKDEDFENFNEFIEDEEEETRRILKSLEEED